MAKELSLFRGRCPTLERRRLWSATQNGNGARGISHTEDVAEGGQKKTACRAAKTTLSFLRKEKTAEHERFSWIEGRSFSAGSMQGPFLSGMKKAGNNKSRPMSL